MAVRNRASYDVKSAGSSPCVSATLVVAWSADWRFAGSRSS